MEQLQAYLQDKRNIWLVVAILLIAGSGYYFYTVPWTEFEARQAELAQKHQAAQNELDKINAERYRIPFLEQELVQVQADFNRLKEMFPDEEKVPLRLQDLYAVIRASGVAIQRFVPEPKQEKEHYNENKYSIVVNSGYHMLGYLFAEIANFNYPTSIDNLKLNRAGNIAAEVKKAEEHGWEPVTTSVTFSLTTYTSKKSSAQAPAAKK